MWLFEAKAKLPGSASAENLNKIPSNSNDCRNHMDDTRTIYNLYKQKNIHITCQVSKTQLAHPVASRHVQDSTTGVPHQNPPNSAPEDSKPKQETLMEHFTSLAIFGISNTKTDKETRFPCCHHHHHHHHNHHRDEKRPWNRTSSTHAQRVSTANSFRLASTKHAQKHLWAQQQSKIYLRDEYALIMS